MKDEITRIMRLVKEGKISPEDAAELIDAFSEGEPQPEPEPVTAGAAAGSSSGASSQEEAQSEAKTASKPENPFSSLIGAIEGIAKEVSTKVDWKDIASQVSQGVDKSVDAIRKAAEEAKVGQGFRFLFGNHESKTVEMPLTVPAGKILKIEASNGSVRVVGSEGLGHFKVKASFRAATQEDAKKKASLYTPVIEESDQHIVLKLQEGPDSEVDAEIQVAPGASVEVRTSSGRVSVTGIHGAVRINGASASIEGAGLRGPLDVSVASGSIHLGDIETSLANLETKSGDVALSEAKGSFVIRSSSGDVNLDRCSGRSLTVESASGDVRIDLDRPVTGTLNVRAVSGDVNVEVADGSDARTVLSAVQGDVACLLDLQDRVELGSRITGRLGEGVGVIDLSTVSGDVRLAMRDNPTSEAKEEPAAEQEAAQEPPKGAEDDSPSFH